MIEAYSNNITVSSNSLVPFKTVFKKNNSVVMSGDSTIQFKKCGIYDVSVNATGIAQAGGNVNLQLVINGVEVPYAFATETAGDTTSLHNLAFTAKVQVPATVNGNCPCSPDFTVSVINAGVETTYSLVNILVEKRC